MGSERLARYSLAGPENQAAVDAGLAGADWFRSEVPRKRMKELMRRSDYPAILARSKAQFLPIMAALRDTRSRGELPASVEELAADPDAWQPH